jgi:CxxC motif-containing protein
MEIHSLTCIECPIGCQLEIGVENGNVAFVKGNTCPRGKLYGENEVVCPRRVLTTTVRLKDGRMLPVKTDKPIQKARMFAIMEKINKVTWQAPVTIGDIVFEKVDEDINLIATGNFDKE